MVIWLIVRTDGELPQPLRNRANGSLTARRADSRVGISGSSVVTDNTRHQMRNEGKDRFPGYGKIQPRGPGMKQYYEHCDENENVSTALTRLINRLMTMPDGKPGINEHFTCFWQLMGDTVKENRDASWTADALTPKDNLPPGMINSGRNPFYITRLVRSMKWVMCIFSRRH